MGLLDDNDSKPVPQENMFQLGPGSKDVDLDEINAYLQRGQEDDAPPEPAHDKLRAMAVPPVAVFNQAKLRKEEANALLKEAKYEDALLQYHRGIWLLMDGEENFKGHRTGVTKANIGKGVGVEHFKTANFELRDEVKALRITLHSNMALAALKLQRFEVAKIAAEFVIEADIQNVKALYRLAQAYEGLQEWKSGLDTLRVLLDQDPGNAAAQDMQNRMTQEHAKQKKKDKKQFSGMFERMQKDSELGGEELYKADDVKAANMRSRAALRKQEMAQGPRRLVLNLPEMTPEEREHASRRFQTATDGEDVSNMCQGLPQDAIDRIKEKFAAGHPKEEIEVMGYCETLCLNLFTPDSRQKLREMLKDNPTHEEVADAACRLAIEDSSFLGQETTRKALEFQHEGKLKDAWDLIKEERNKCMVELHLNYFVPPEEAAVIRELRDLEENDAQPEEVEPLALKAAEMKDKRIRASLTEQGVATLKQLEDAGAPKEEIDHFFNECEKGHFDEFMATQYKEFQNLMAAMARKIKEKEASMGSSSSSS